MKNKSVSNQLIALPDSMKMPVFFLGHGSPMNAIEENEFVKSFRQIGEEITVPQAILCISAHWETRGTAITAMKNPKTIHDFSGFPKALFDVDYPAPGNPNLANTVKSMVTETEVALNYNWGLDHGAWTVIKHLYPEANVPVVQLSLDYTKPAEYHYNLARELRQLRNKGVLIIGSGNQVHNLRKVAWDRLGEDDFGFDWARTASDKMKSLMLEGNHQKLIHYNTLGPEFNLAIPTPEHYLPLLYTLALQEDKDALSFFNDKAIGGSLTMTSVKITATE